MTTSRARECQEVPRRDDRHPAPRSGRTPRRRRRAPAHDPEPAATAGIARLRHRDRRPPPDRPRRPDDPRGLPRQRHRGADAVLRAQAARLRRLPHVRRRGRGRGDTAHQLLAAAEPDMVVQTQTPRLRQMRKTNLELIFSDHNAYCLPPCQNKCPSHIDIPGFLKANTEGNFIESARIFKRTIPFPSVLGRVCPAPCEEHCRRDEVEEAIAIRDSHRYAGDQVLKAQAAGAKAPVPVRGPSRQRQARGGHRLRPGRAWPRPTTSPSRARRHRLRARPGAGGMLRYGIPQYRLPKVEVLEAEYQSAWDLGVKLVTRRRAGPRLHHRRPPEPGLRRGLRGHRLLRHQQAGHPRARTPTACSTASSTCASPRSACPIRAMPGSAWWSSVAASPPWTARAPRSARAPREVTLVYRRDMKDMPAANEVHEMIEEGRGPSSRRRPPGS